MITPVQRIPRYLLFLREFLKYTKPDDADYDNVKKAYSQFESLTSFLNESKRVQDQKEKVQEMKRLILNLDEGTFLQTKFIFEGTIKKKKVYSKGGDSLRKSLDRLGLSPKNTRKEVAATGSANMLRQSVETTSPATAKRHATEYKEKWQDIMVYVFSDVLLCAKRISAKTFKTMRGSLMQAFKGAGWHKFSALKSINLAGVVLELDKVIPTVFYLRDSEGNVHEFQTETQQQRDTWVHSFKDTIVLVK